jgi:multiple sugar transport system permease protein
MPRDTSTAHYVALFADRDFLIPIRNSLIVAALTTLLTLPLAALCAYALARLQMPGRSILLALVLSV